LADAVYRTPEARFAGLPGFAFEPHYAEIDGVRMHYLDQGQGDPVLLLHGEPTWSFLYRTMIPALSGRFRCVAPDYIGFGRSDKWTEVGAYSFARHFSDLERFAEALDLRRITLVVQDWGGPLGLHYAVRHPDRVARLVILNTGLLSGEAETLSPGLVRWREYALRTPDLPIGQIIKRSVADRASLSDAVVAAYDAPFPTFPSKAGARAFPPRCPSNWVAFSLLSSAPRRPSASPPATSAGCFWPWGLFGVPFTCVSITMFCILTLGVSGAGGGPWRSIYRRRAERSSHAARYHFS
jgi:haloalkane dehalogenase